MSRVAAQDHAPVEATPRKTMTRGHALAILQRQDGRCAGCGRPLAWVSNGTVVYMPFEVDHVQSLWMGGADDDTNLEALCPAPCHLKKTRIDAAARAKAKRLSSPSKRQKRKIASRPFPKRREDSR